MKNKSFSQKNETGREANTIVQSPYIIQCDYSTYCITSAYKKMQITSFLCFLDSLRPTRSHAQTNQNTGAPSLLGSDRGLIWTYMANAVTATSPAELSKKRSVCEPVGMTHCVPTGAARTGKTVSEEIVSKNRCQQNMYMDNLY